ncbi:MAG: MoaD/ThiS family protein [Desulfofustis sp.]|nr:MoaD/ThiS family protein [Desulfofustis sp.]
MQLTVKLFAYFRDNRFVAEVKEYPRGISVGEIIEQLEINPADVGITMLNSRHCRPEAQPADGDILAIFPVVGGG